MSPPLNRRHLLRVAAWSVPVISLAAAAPAYAASGDGTLTALGSQYEPDSGHGSMSVLLDPAPGPPLDTGYFTFSDPDFYVVSALYDLENLPGQFINLDYQARTVPGAAGLTVFVTVPGYTPLAVAVGETQEPT